MSDLEYKLKIVYKTVCRASGIADLVIMNSKIYIFFDPYNKYIIEYRRY
jgi:hypothetical protein